MSNHQTGHTAEKQAADYLRGKGFTIRELNWKTKLCEIDIVASKVGVIYFVEVKYRRNSLQGHAADYVTPKKLRQMQFAAELWVQHHDWTGDYELAVVAIDSEQISLLESLAL